MPKRLRLVAVPLVLIAAFGVTRASEAAVPQVDKRDPITVVTTAYPLYEVAAAIGGERVEVDDLIPTAAFAYDQPFGAEDQAQFQEAQLAIVPGQGTQPQVSPSIAKRTGETIEVLDSIKTQPAPDGVAGDANPYVWLDPTLLGAIASDVQKRLTLMDPEGEQYYLARSADYRAFLARIDRSYAHDLAGCSSKILVSETPYFGYLASRYGLREYVLPMTDNAVGSGDVTVSEVQSEPEVTTVFTSELPPSREARQIFNETGLRIAVLDPIANRTDQARRGGANYEKVMRLNLVALRNALGCTDAFGGQ